MEAIISHFEDSKQESTLLIKKDNFYDEAIFCCPNTDSYRFSMKVQM